MTNLQPSAITTLLENASTKSPREALAIEALHNLQYQHRWTDLKLFTVLSPTSSSNTSTPTSSPSRTRPRGRSQSPAQSVVYLISGLPPRHLYIHPDMQKWLIRNNVTDEDVDVQREWVLPLSLGERWSLRQFCWVFDGLPEREVLRLSKDGSVDTEDEADFEWKDSKRALLGMLAHNGMGGDGTIAYYIMQEGEVKPRQNG
ncbi:hypothetical protein LTR05_000309 [Lithohypha guttulata]|uniref:tRNA-splicing endonuclease subunit Sen15 domain-containing protein n=1 Tax=Lithohypha guttulata TaxID=1690604 RepID=A0AAN7T5Y9_9EURO|nr:hypothetical protein LTR05_000309 [Lithohypha guttulata]